MFKRKHRRYFAVALAIATFCAVFPQHARAAAPTPVGQFLKAYPKLAKLPKVGEARARRVLRVTVTAYSSTPDQTDASPFITASGSRVRPGTLAVNGLPFGTRIRFPHAFGDRVFTVEDRTNARYGRLARADIWMPTRGDALKWGVKYLVMEVL